MNLQFSVHNPHRTTIAQSVIYRGETGRATMDCFEVELVALDGASGAIKLRLMGSDIEQAEALFQPDSIANIEITAVSGMALDADGNAPAALTHAA